MTGAPIGDVSPWPLWLLVLQLAVLAVMLWCVWEITGFKDEPRQLAELLRRGFKRGGDGRLVVERAHYEAVCAGTAMLSAQLAAKGLQLPALERVPMPVQVTAPPPSVPPPPPLRKGRPMVTLEQWAALNYSEPPSTWVLGSWRRNGEIYPMPQRVGRHWFVPEDARRLLPGQPLRSLIDRI